MSATMHRLPINTRILAASLVLSTLILVASLLGLFTASPYALETENWRLQARGQDVGNLLGMVILLMSAVLAAKGSIKSYLIWLGTLFYFLYAYAVYAFAVHFNSLFLVYVAILGISLYTIIAALNSKPDGATYPEAGTKKFASYTLIGTGVLFALLWLSEIIPSLLTGKAPQSLAEAGLWVNPIHVLDLSIVLPSFILTGVMALKNRQIGQFFVAPWLTFSVLMGSSIVAAMALMLFSNFPDTIPPMIMVGAIVLVSLIALTLYLRKTSK